MILNIPEDPSKACHQEILEEKEAMTDYVVDVLPRCRRIIDFARAGINKKVFLNGTLGRNIVDDILNVARTTLQYRRQRRNKRVRYTQ